MPIYRAVPIRNFVNNRRIVRHPGKRLPGNIPYLVDNLWEFARPEAMPSRRHAVYASPTAELALENALVPNTSAADYVVCEVAFERPAPMIQLSVKDARWHPDVGTLQRAVNAMIEPWVDIALSKRLPLAPLFMPGATKVDLTEAMEGSPELLYILMQVSKLVTLWDDAAAPSGELFFELTEDNAYRLTHI